MGTANTATLVGASTAFVASAATAFRGVPRWESSLFATINHRSDALQYLAWAPMQAGALAAPLAIGSAIAMRGDKTAGTTTALAGLAAWGAAKVVKRWVDRNRPLAAGEDVRLRIGASDSGLGFPSGHAAVAAVVAATVPMPSSRVRRLAMVPSAATVGVSRIYVGAHYPLDVVGGWALGSLIAKMAKAVPSKR